VSGERLANKYNVVRRLAIGGMGEVLLAEFDGDAEVTAGLLVVKRILSAAPGLPPNEGQVRMLLEEGRLGLRLSHENLVDTFRIENDNKSPLLVIELLAGRSMAQVLGQAKKRQEMVPWEVALAVLRGACCGLHFAHTLKGPDGQSLGLVHRDVSPANIFVTFDGKVKVIDFGVAKSEDSEVKTATGILKGKLGYMSPEQSLGAGKLTPAADVWSLGVFFWEMLLAERLFSSPNPTATLLQISQKPIPAPRSIRADLPAAVETIAMTMLARPLEDRYKSCAEVVAAIDAVIGNVGAIDVGGFLAGRFPEEAASGAAEAARCARRKGQTRVAAGLEDGAVGVDPAEEDEFATAILPSSLREQLLSATGPMSVARGSNPDLTEDVDDLATVRVSADIVNELRQGARTAPSPSPQRPPAPSGAFVDEDDMATRRVDADIARRARDPSVTERNVIDGAPPQRPVDRAPSGAFPRRPTPRGLQVTPSPSGDGSGRQRAAPTSPNMADPPSRTTPAPTRPSTESATMRVAPSWPEPASASTSGPMPSTPAPTPSQPSSPPSGTFPSPPSLSSATVPMVSSPSPSSPPARAPSSMSQAPSTSWLAVAVGTFGALVVLMGIGFSFAMPTPQPHFVVYQDLAGHSVVVGDRAQVPVGRASQDLDVTRAALTKSAEKEPTLVDAAELEARLKSSGVWARATLPMTSKAKTAALLPLLIVGIGLLALAFAVPSAVLRGTSRLGLQATLMVLTVALVLVMLQRGGLSWPGYGAFQATPTLEWKD
jgi:serine/threonine-protein kinase